MVGPLDGAVVLRVGDWLVVAVAIGRVIRFDQARGYGFIAPDDGGEDVFLHAAEVGVQTDIRVGTQVEFQAMDSQRGLKAYDVKVLSSPAGTAASPRPSVTRRPDDSEDDDDWDLLTEREYAAEITDALISECPEMTAAQIVAIRRTLAKHAREHGWLAD